MFVLRVIEIFIMLKLLIRFSFGQEIELFKIRQEDCNTKCTSGLLGYVDRLLLNSTVTLRNELHHNSVVAFDIRLKTKKKFTHFFSVDIKSECAENKKTGDFYHCSKISENSYNISIHLEGVSLLYSKASIRCVIKHNQTKLARDELTLPNIVESTDVTGILTVNGKNITNLEECEFVIDEAEFIIDVDFVCIGPATPCLVEISSNDSTKIVVGANRAVFKRFLFQDVTFKVQIKYALCRLDWYHRNTKCIITKRGQSYQRITMIIVTITGIPTALVLFFSISSFFKVMAIKKKSVLITKDFVGNPDEAEPLNTTVLEMETIKKTINDSPQFTVNDESFQEKKTKEEMSNALMQACEHGHADAVEMLIKNGADINMKGTNGLTSLMLVSKRGHCKIADILIKNGAAVNISIDNGITALMLESQSGHINSVEVLLENGADTKVKDSNGMTALMYASEKGLTDVAEMLVEKKANINDVSIVGSNALMLASLAGHTKIVKLLIEKGADVCHKNQDGMTAFMLASQTGHTETVQILIDMAFANKVPNPTGKTSAYTNFKIFFKVNDKNIHGQTALMLASYKGHIDIVDTLLKFKANVNKIDINGSTSLIFASRKGHLEIVRKLVNAGANVNHATTVDRTALMYSSKIGHTEVVQLLYENNGDVNKKDTYGMTALMFALKNNHQETADLLLKNGAKVKQLNLSLHNNYGWTCLMFASEKGLTSTVGTIIEMGANVDNINILGRNAFMYACLNGHTETAALLLKNIKNINRKDSDGLNALMLASSHGHAQTCRWLVENKARVQDKDKRGKTALMYALENKHEEIVKILIDCGVNGNEQGEHGMNG